MVKCRVLTLCHVLAPCFSVRPNFTVSRCFLCSAFGPAFVSLSWMRLVFPAGIWKWTLWTSATCLAALTSSFESRPVRSLPLPPQPDCPSGHVTPHEHPFVPVVQPWLPLGFGLPPPLPLLLLEGPVLELPGFELPGFELPPLLAGGVDGGVGTATETCVCAFGEFACPSEARKLKESLP